jgi:hypothetical protein
MHARRIIVTVVCAFAVLIPAAAASATTYTTSACTMLTTWSVGPALNTGTHGGTINASYTGSCAGAYAGTDPEAGEDLYPTSWSNSYSYFGSCALASSSYYGSWGSATIIGGSVLVGIADNPFYDIGELWEVTVVAPLLPCSQTSATGASEAGFVGSYS